MVSTTTDPISEPVIPSPVPTLTVAPEPDTARTHVLVERDVPIVSITTDPTSEPAIPSSMPTPIVQVDSATARTHIRVELDVGVEPEDKTRFAELGLELLQPLDRHVWYASVLSRDLANVAGLEGVRQVQTLEPQYKLSKELQEDPAPYDHQQRDRDRVAYLVLFHKDVTADQVQVLADLGQVEFENFNPASFGVVRAVTLNVPKNELQALAETDIIARIEPAPGPQENDNRLNAQPLSNVDVVQDPTGPFNLDGTGVTVGVWEARGVVYANHLDLTPRVIAQAGQISANDDHAVHVAGIIGASGINVADAEGMAPNVTIASWDSRDDTNEMTSAATSAGNADQPTPIQISNHSYGLPIGWNDRRTTFSTNPQTLFGQYDIRSQSFDNVVAQDGLIVVKSAGNHRTNIPRTPVPGQPGDCLQRTFPQTDLDGDGVLDVVAGDCISPVGAAKNVITVGAMNGSGAIAGFSSYGPTDDGRIKPDLMAQGVNMLSLASNSWFTDRTGPGGLPDGVDDVPNSTTANVVMSGTSMATPVVSGVAALVLQEAGTLNIPMPPAAMKALLIQTARDVQGMGQATIGPDYATGWGIVDTEAAVNLLRQGGLVQGTLNSTGIVKSRTRTFNVPAGLAEIHLTLVWDDPAAIPGERVLVNDLDLRLIAPNGTVFTPWTLDLTDPGQAAVRNGGNDATNNVEQVSVETPMAGVWTARVSSNAFNLPQAPQAFSVAGPFDHFSLWSWGANRSGRLGDGSNLVRREPTSIGSGTWQAVAATRAHTMAIAADGSLWGWGKNLKGQLGDGTTEERHSPVQIGIDTSWKVVATGGSHTAAIRSDGSLWTWGLYSQLGGPFSINRAIPAQLGADSWRAVTAGPLHTAAIKTDGTLWTWGSPANGRLGHEGAQKHLPTSSHWTYESPVRVGGDRWEAVAAGHSHTLGIKSDGTLWAWGKNSYGQLGDGTTDDRDRPTKVGSDTWRSVAAGFGFSLAIKADGTLWTWGWNRHNQLGDGTTIDRHVPTQIGSNTWTNIGGGRHHSVAIKSDGTLWSWGRNANVGLGDGTNASHSRPIQIGSGTWTDISVGYWHTIAVATATFE